MSSAFANWLHILFYNSFLAWRKCISRKPPPPKKKSHRSGQNINISLFASLGNLCSWILESCASHLKYQSSAGSFLVSLNWPVSLFLCYKWILIYDIYLVSTKPHSRYLAFPVSWLYFVRASQSCAFSLLTAPFFGGILECKNWFYSANTTCTATVVTPHALKLSKNVILWKGFSLWKKWDWKSERNSPCTPFFLFVLFVFGHLPSGASHAVRPSISFVFHSVAVPTCTLNLATGYFVRTIVALGELNFLRRKILNSQRMLPNSSTAWSVIHHPTASPTASSQSILGQSRNLRRGTY